MRYTTSATAGVVREMAFLFALGLVYRPRVRLRSMLAVGTRFAENFTSDELAVFTSGVNRGGSMHLG
jgi:hypothetical protein